MTISTSLLRPFSRLVKITIFDSEVQVPENNPLLRCFQYLEPQGVSYARFCWNQDCQYCSITFDRGEGTPQQAGLSCRVMVEEGMRIKKGTADLRYALQELKLKNCAK